MVKVVGLPDLSVVIPVYNEADNVLELHRELGLALEGLSAPRGPVRDDGSTDATPQRLVEIEGRDPRVRVLRLRRNFGQTAAFSAGFDHARGRVVVTSDGDLQNDPADIPRLLAKLDEVTTWSAAGAAATGRTPSPAACPPAWPTA